MIHITGNKTGSPYEAEDDTQHQIFKPLLVLSLFVLLGGAGINLRSTSYLTCTSSFENRPGGELINRLPRAKSHSQTETVKRVLRNFLGRVTKTCYCFLQYTSTLYAIIYAAVWVKVKRAIQVRDDQSRYPTDGEEHVNRCGKNDGAIA